MFLQMENCIQNFSGDAVQPSHLMKFLTKVSDPLLDKHQDRSLLWLYDATVRDHWDVLPFFTPTTTSI